MTFQVSALEVGATTYYNVTTTNWEVFHLQLVKEHGIEGWGPDRFTIQKEEGKWLPWHGANPDRVRMLQREIDDFFWRHGQTVQL